MSCSGPISAETLRIYDSLCVDIVKPKVINSIALSQRQRPVLGTTIFEMFRLTQEEVLKNLLLGWDATEFCFREIVHAILCIASPSKNLFVVKSRRVIDSPGAGYSDIVSRDQPRITHAAEYIPSDSDNSSDSDSDIEQRRGEKTTSKNNADCISTPSMTELEDFNGEFVAHFGIGCHLQGNPRGSSAEESVYWFEGVLVVLAVQLNRTGAVAESVTRVSRV